MVKADEPTPVNPLALKLMVAPLTCEMLVAVKLVKVAVPLIAAIVVVPPMVHDPLPTPAVMLAVLVVLFPYWSCMAISGWVTSAPPLEEGAAGCVNTESLFAAPAPMLWLTVALL